MTEKPFNEPGQPVFDGHLRPVIEQPSGFFNLSKRDRHIAGLVRQAPQNGVPAGKLFEQRDKFAKFDRVRVTKVDDFKAEGPVERGENALHNVGDVRVVAPGRAAAEKINRLAGQNRAREFVDGEVRPLPGTVNSEEPEADDFEPVEVMVDVGERFAGEFGGGVWRDWLGEWIVFPEWHALVYAVDAGRGSEDEFIDAEFTGEFEKILGAGNVDVGIKPSLSERRANAGAGGEMDDGGETGLLKHFAQLVGVADIAGDDGGPVDYAGEVAVFDGGRVEIVEVIENCDRIAARAELFNNVGANETGTACDENIHQARLYHSPPAGADQKIGCGPESESGLELPSGNEAFWLKFGA